MTSAIQLHSLDPEEVDDWNAAEATEQIVDVAGWHQLHVPPRSDVRLRFSAGEFLDHRPVPSHERSRILPLAVIPPLVNAHTHLEFSTLTQPISPVSPFPDWIRSVIRWRAVHSDSNFTGVSAGLSECSSHGVSAIGEITTSDDATHQLQTGMTNIVSFRELIGLLPGQVPAQIELMNRHLECLTATPQTLVSPGISPHAPYSVHPDLVAAAAEFCGSHSIPLAMHLAETCDELELLGTGTGVFVDFLKQMNLWDPDVLSHGTTILRYLQQLAKLPHALAVHSNYLTDKEIHFLGENPQITVVYCPRTHHFFGHRSHPWQRILAAGGRVVLGTDGRGSNPDLSIWNELQFVASRSGNASAIDLLPMVTTHAAEALGFDDHWNSHGPFRGTVIRLPVSCRDRHDALLSPHSRPAARLVSDGHCVKMMLCEPPGEPNAHMPATSDQ